MSGPIAGVSLEEYAGVSAALAEGFALEEILAAERIAAGGWPTADAGWKQRLARDGAAGGPLFASYRAKLEEAEDCLMRAVSPIDEDVEAWVTFLRAWSSSADPAGLVAGLGLTGNDVSRLRRKWAKRMDDDRRVGIAAAKIAARGTGTLPTITVAPARLKPFPWSKRPAEAAKPAHEAAPPPDDFSLDRYARLAAELSLGPATRPSALDRYGLDEARFAAIDRGWQAALAADPALASDFRRLFGHHRARLDAAKRLVLERAAPAYAQAPALPRAPARAHAPALADAAIDETAILVAALGDDALPFDDPGVARPPPRAALGPSPDAGETAVAIDAIDLATLPFGVAAVDETAMVEAIAVDALPFAPSVAVLAQVAVELARAPHDRAAVLARHRLSEPAANSAFADLQRRFALDAGVRAEWNRAYAAHQAKTGR